MPNVSLLSVTPVKGLGLHHPEETGLEPSGVPGDRRFCLIDEHGQRFTGVKFGPLVRIQADYDVVNDWFTLTFPSGESVTGPVRLDGPITTQLYGPRTIHGHLVEGPWNEALSRYAGRPVRLVHLDSDQNGWDVYPVTLLSEASVEELSRHAGQEKPLDVRRFRMLVTISDGYPHQEDEWIGKTVRIGSAQIYVPGGVPRCVVTTQDPDEGNKDADVLRMIKDCRGLSPDGSIQFGVYGTVVASGAVRLGDAVSPL